MNKNITKNKNYCILPFIHLSIFNNRIKPCCRFGVETDFVRNINKDINLNDVNNLTDILNHREYQLLREKIIKGERIEGCYKCYIEDDSSCESLRVGSNNLYQDYLTNDLRPKLKFLEIGFSNICNNRCRTCSSDLSTAWRDDDIKLEKIFKFRNAKHEVIEVDIKAFKKNKISELSELEYLKIVGGEPMLDPNFKKFLKQLIKSGINEHCHLDVFTNASYFPNNKIIELIKAFKTSRIHLSIDGYGKTNNYIRYPSMWQLVNNSAGKWLSLGSENQEIIIQLEVTISIYNIYYLDDLIDWWRRKCDETGNTQNAVHFIFVFKPDFLSTINVPEIIKNRFIDRINILKDKYSFDENLAYNFNNLHTFLSSKGKDMTKDFIIFTEFLDEIRKESFQDILPELAKLIKFNFFNKLIRFKYE